MVAPAAPGTEEPLVVKPRVVVTGATGRRALIEDYPLAAGEYLVEVTDRITDNHAYLVQPVDSRAEVVGKFIPVLRKALFADGAELRMKAIYKVHELKGIERTIDSKSGDTIESRVLNLFVIKRGPTE